MKGQGKFKVEFFKNGGLKSVTIDAAIDASINEIANILGINISDIKNFKLIK